MSEEDTSSSPGHASPISPSQQQLSDDSWRGAAGSRSGGPRSLLLKRSENGFGFTLRHFIVYPPESYTVVVPGCGRGGAEPMDTMFVKSVRPNSPAARAGLQTGDRVVSVNGQTVCGALTYAHVVHMISQSPSHLHLLVVPRQDDLLQLYFGDTAHNPETNPRVRLRSPSCDSGAVRRSPSRLLSSTVHHQSVPPLTPPPLSHHHHNSRLAATTSLATPSSGGSSSGRVSSEREWRRASDGGAGGAADEGVAGGLAGSGAESGSLDSGSRDFHSSDDSLIIDRIRKSFEQKEEFLFRRPAAAPRMGAPLSGGGGATPPPPIQWPAAIPASCVPLAAPLPATVTEQVPWRSSSSTVSAKAPAPHHLTRIDETGGGVGGVAAGGAGGSLVPVSARAQVFEEGAGGVGGRGSGGVQLFRSELAGLSEKRSAPDVALRRRQFEAHSKTVDVSAPSSLEEENARRSRTHHHHHHHHHLQSRSLDMPCSMSGNRTTPVGGSRLHCEPPSSTSPSLNSSSQGMVTSSSGSSIGGGGASAGAWQRHKAVRQDSYLAACHKPQANAANTEVAAAAAADADGGDESKENKKQSKKKKKLKSSSLRSAVRPTRLDLGKVARPLSCGPAPSPDNKDESSSAKQSPTEDHQQNLDVDQSHQRRVSYLKQIWTENANRGPSSSPTPSPPASTQLSERLKQQQQQQPIEGVGVAGGGTSGGPLLVVEGSLMCSVGQERGVVKEEEEGVAKEVDVWRPVWAILRGPVLHLMRLKQAAETPNAVSGSATSGADQLADREEWWSEDLVVARACVCALDRSPSSPAKHQLIRVQVTSSSSQEQLLLLQAPDVTSHQQWLRALHAVVGKPAGEEVSASVVQQQQQQQHQQQQNLLQPQQQQQAPSPKCKTWKGRVAKQFRRIGQGAGGAGGSSPISPTAPPAPASSAYQEGASIGVPLDWCPQSRTHEGVPLLVEVCCAEVEARGLEVVGVYRVPGNTAAVTALTEQVNRGGAAVAEGVAQLVAGADVNVVSSLLKSLFRRLPDALLTSDLYPLFIAADKIADPLLRVATIRKLVHSLPDHHFETLRFVMAHLARVVGRSEVNKMEARNLAIVFGPTLVRPTPDDDSMLTLVTDMSHQCRIVETLITHAEWCFSDDDIDRLQLTVARSGGVGESGEGGVAPVAPPTVDHISENHSLLLENIHKVQGMKSGSSDMSTTSSSGGGGNLKDISAKDIVVSIIGAANRKMHKSKSRSGSGSGGSSSSSKQQTTTQTTSEEVGGTSKGGVAASIRESVLFSGSILAASSSSSSSSSRRRGKGGGTSCTDGVGGSQEGVADEKGAGLNHQPAAVDKDGMIRTYTGLSACKQERIRRFEQETKAMLQRENAARGGESGGLLLGGVEERSKRELDGTALDESPPSGVGGEDLLSSLTSTFDAKLRSLLSSTGEGVSGGDGVEVCACAKNNDDVAAAAVSSQLEEKEGGGGGGRLGESGPVEVREVGVAFRDPSLHRSTSTTNSCSSSSSTSSSYSSSSTGQQRQLNFARNSCDGSLKQQQLHQQSVREEVVVVEREASSSSSVLDREGRMVDKGKSEEGEEEEEKKDDSLATKDPLSCKEQQQDVGCGGADQEQDEEERKQVVLLRRSESLEKRALKNADDSGTAGGREGKISRRSSDRALKRSDSLTKSEKTESNLYRRSQQQQQQASKRKNGAVGGQMSSGEKVGGGGGDRCAIKRRHTVGGTKDFTWTQDGDRRQMSAVASGDLQATVASRRTSSPDLSAGRVAVGGCCTHARLVSRLPVVVAATDVVVVVPAPLESHV